MFNPFSALIDATQPDYSDASADIKKAQGYFMLKVQREILPDCL